MQARRVAAQVAASTSSTQQRAAVCQALPPRRRASPRSRRRTNEQQQQPQDLSEDELIRQLNSPLGGWLPEADEDFALDDVAAHIAGRDEPQVVAASGGGSQAAAGPQSRRAARRAAAEPTDLTQLDPSTGAPLPAWVDSLRSEGFDVMTRNGQLFLQRGKVGVQQQQQQQQQQEEAAWQQDIDDEFSDSIDDRQQQQQQEQAGAQQQADRAAAAAAAAAAVPVSDKMLAVRQEFAAAFWQQALRGAAKRGRGADPDPDEAPAAPPTAAGAWYSSTPSTRQQQQQRAGQPAEAQPLPAVQQAPPSAGAAGVPLKPAAVQHMLLGFREPPQLLALLLAVFPAWADNGCWLVDQLRAGVVSPAPTPAEAAFALKGLALAAKRARLNAVQLQSLARDRVVLGLCECLRLTPPRTAPHQPPDLQRRMWSVAKAYWLTGGSTAAALQQLLAATQAAAAASGDGQQQLEQLLGRPAALGPLLARLQASGRALTKQQLAAAQSLVQASSDEQLRRSAAAAALWALGCLGGHLFFQAEMEALCQVAQAKLARWQLAAAELSDVAWALATSRHATPLMAQLEAALLAVGGPAAATSGELVTLLWAFASLSVTPQQLLQQLNTHGWVARPDARPTGSSSSSSAGSKQHGRQQPLPAAGSSHGLGGLRDGQLTTLAWSLAVMQQVDGPLFRAVWAEVCARSRQLVATDARGLVQLAQAATAIRLEASYAPADLSPGPDTEALLSAAAGAFQEQARALQTKRVHSTYQRAIACTLSGLRVMHVLEDNTAAGYSVDVTIPSLRVAIEADGPSHFARTRPGGTAAAPAGLLRLGATAMKRRHLQGLGWAVVNVPYSTWDRLADEEARARYLKQQIVAARQSKAGAATAAGSG